MQVQSFSLVPINIFIIIILFWCIYNYCAHVYGSQRAIPDHTTYCASKGAVNQITRTMAIELGPHGIRTNSVNPTVVLTPMGIKAWSDPAKSQPIMNRIPLGRFAGKQIFKKKFRHEAYHSVQFGSLMITYCIDFCFFFLETDDVANAVIFMLSDYSTMVNGTSLVVDGGFLSGQKTYHSIFLTTIIFCLGSTTLISSN